MRDKSKIVFGAVIAIALGTAVFLAGLYSGVTRNVVFKGVQSVADSFAEVWGEADNLIEGGDPVHFLQPAYHEGRGVTVNELPANNDDLILISGFFDGQNGLRLMNRNGEILAKWSASYTGLFPDPSYLEFPPRTDQNVDIHGISISPDGSVIFNFEYAGTVRLDRCGDLAWTLRHPTHHSIEPAHTGGFWIPGRVLADAEQSERLRPFSALKSGKQLELDTVALVSPEGSIVSEFSVPELLVDAGLLPTLTATGQIFSPNETWDREVVHLNKIDELTPDMADAFPQFAAGDLLLSLREYNMLLVVSPDGSEVKWHQIGPWLRQHDPEFHSSGRILLFNNNTFRTDLDAKNRLIDPTRRISNILWLDPETGAASVAYGFGAGQDLLSVIRGKVQALPNGLMISEHEAGRVIQTNENGKTVWSYVNRFDDTQVLEITEGRLYPADYFSVTDWSCPS